MTKRAALLAIAGIMMGMAISAPSRAQEWPNRVVTIVVATAAGGNTDLMARLAAEYLTKTLGKPFVVENRPSAGGIIASTQVVNSPPDGHTMLFAPSAVVLLTPLVQKMPFDPESMLTPVTNVGTGAQVMAVKRSLPIKTLSEFLKYGKEHPGKLNFVIGGANNLSHLAPVLLFKQAGVDAIMVPTRGESDAITSLMSGDSDFYFGNASMLLQYAEHDSIRLVAVGTSERIAAAPAIPTASETVPGFEFSSWNGFFLPKATPEPIQEKLRKTVADMVAQPEISKRLSTMGITPGGQSKEQVQATFDRDRANYAAAAAAAGIVKQ